MQLITLLIQKLDDAAKNAMAQAIQSNPAELEKGLNQMSRLFLGVLVQPPLNRIQVENIQKVVEEGGHTGELLSNLPSLLADEQRSGLLIDIGTKIFHHFYEGDTETLVEKLTMVLGIRKSVIQSILGLTPPLVLGVIGSQMRKERWDTADLQTFLENQQSDVESELSPYLTPHLTSKAPVSIPTPEAKVKVNSPKESTKKKSNFQFFTWLPWILLGLLSIASWWYLNKLQKGDTESTPITDSLSVLSDDANFDQIEEMLNQSGDSVPPVVTAPNTVTNPPASPAIEPALEKPKVEDKPQVQEPTKVESRKTEAPTQKPPANKPVTPVAQGSTKSDQPKASSNVSAALRNTFQSGSAEIKEDQAIKTLADSWKSNRAGVVVIEGNFSNRLTEDQAYALRERLFQLGIPISSIRMEKSNSALQISLK